MWLQLIISLAALIIGFLSKTALSKYKEKKSTSGQNALFFGFEKETKFVFPSREEIPSAILPRMSTEDFLGINNLISAFIFSGLKPPTSVVDDKNITEQDKKQNNLILICSSTSNKVTKEALELLRKSNPNISELIPKFEPEDDHKRYHIRWRNAIYPSESYDQNGPELTDIAVILKAKNPWAAQYRILIVAGVRGIGTWGAAEFLKKWWQPLYEKKAASKITRTSKTGEFVAILKIWYREYDIKRAELLSHADLDDKFDHNN